MKHSYDKKSGTSLQEMSPNTASPLTSTAGIDRNLCMDGKIRTKEKCPKCKGKFKGIPLQCPACLITPKKYFIDLYVKSFGRIRLYSDKRGHPLDSFRGAQRVIEHIRYEIDQHIFDPTRYTASDLMDFLFETRVDEWYESKKKDATRGNLARSYTRGIDCFIRLYYNSFFKGMDVRDIRAFHIQRFYDQLPEGKSLKYVSNIMKALENFFNVLHRYDYISKKPAFPVITLDRKTPRWVDYETQLKLLMAIPETHRPIFTLLAYQGIRPSEARALKVKDVNLKLHTLMVVRTFSDRELRERVKNKVVRPRLINPAIQPLLEEVCRDKHPEAFIFTNPRTGRPYSENIISKLWNAARTKVEIDITLYEATRHSLASIAASNGAPLTAIKDVLGHTDFRTTLKYAHNNLESQGLVFQRPPQKDNVIKLK